MSEPIIPAFAPVGKSLAELINRKPPPGYALAVIRQYVDTIDELALLLSPDRHKPVVQRRRPIFRELWMRGYSLPRIGEWFDRDHTTILHSVRAHEREEGLLPFSPVKWVRHMEHRRINQTHLIDGEFYTSRGEWCGQVEPPSCSNDGISAGFVSPPAI